MTHLFEPIAFPGGATAANRFMLAPLTHTMSRDDGTLSPEDFLWLVPRARGGFGLITTAAAHVQASGQGFPGQPGIFSDRHLGGLTQLAQAVKAEGSLLLVQLHHAGARSPADLIGSPPVGPSDNPDKGVRALSLAEVEQLTEDFIAAAERAQRSGCDGVEVHGAHGYVISQFLSPAMNRRTDRYGGLLENRARLLFDVVAGIRARCRSDFLLAVRISPERFGLRLAEMRLIAERLLGEGLIDLLDVSLWDVFKEPEEEEHRGRPLVEHFAGLERGGVRLGVAGKVSSGADAARCLEAGADLVIVGRAAMLHHDFPHRVEADRGFAAVPLPVTADYLRGEGLGERFIQYMRERGGFVTEGT